MSHDPPTRSDIGSLDNGHIDRSEESIACHLRHGVEVEVEETRLPGVDAVAQVGVGLIGYAELDRLCFGQRSVQ